MRTHLKNISHSSSDTRKTNSTAKEADYSTVFKELFCVAASDLASLIQVPLENVGLLHGSIMCTGTLRKRATWKKFRRLLQKNRIDHAEKGLLFTAFGRGQLLFLVRRVNILEAGQIQALGYRFAKISHVVDGLGRSMELRQELLKVELENMRDNAENERFLKAGVHLACFALRPVFQRGFDILVRKDTDYLLPTVQLSDSKLESWQLEILKNMNNWTVATCRERLQGLLLFVKHPEQKFARQLFDAITELASEIDSPFFQDARLIARPLLAPEDNTVGIQQQEHAYILAFRIIADIFYISPSYRTYNYKFAPSKFFLVQQHAYKHSTDNKIFGRRIHSDFAAIAERCNSFAKPPMVCRRSSLLQNTFSHMHTVRRRSRSTSPVKLSLLPSRQHSKYDPTLEENSSGKTDSPPIIANPKQPFGGIHVSNEVRIDVQNLESREVISTDMSTENMGVSTDASIGDIETLSFADELMIFITEERRNQRFLQRA